MDDTARQATRLEAIGGHYDKWLLGAAVALASLGMVMVASSSIALTQSPFYYLNRHVMFIGIGVVLAALLFGFLYQGGAELGLWTSIPIEMRIVVQGLVILFTGALDMMVRMLLTRIFGLVRSQKLGAA